MSIKLMAYPMAFLINPEQSKKVNLDVKYDLAKDNKIVSDKSLKFIKVPTNIKYVEYMKLMLSMQAKRLENSVYEMPSGLIVEWETSAKYMIAKIRRKFSADNLQNIGEEFFNALDALTGRNVRLVNSSEYFYYNYSTEYTEMSEIYKVLKSQGATNIFSTDKDEVVAQFDAKNVRYFHYENEKNYTLEIEQKISIKNIGLENKQENIFYGLNNLKIKTNIKVNELKNILEASNNQLYKANMETPLNVVGVTLNWVKKDNYYIAEFSGYKDVDITKVAGKFFDKLNNAAHRDLRMLNDEMVAIYTYKTNYTDKGVLINTLTEHGAEGITDYGDNIDCRLYGMEMKYYKQNGSNGYTLEIKQVSNKSECEGILADLNEEYGLNIQEMTYNKIKERLDKENMRLESETVMDDNSIILTIEI